MNVPGAFTSLRSTSLGFARLVPNRSTGLIVGFASSEQDPSGMIKRTPRRLPLGQPVLLFTCELYAALNSTRLAERCFVTVFRDPVRTPVARKPIRLLKSRPNVFFPAITPVRSGRRQLMLYPKFSSWSLIPANLG